MNVEKKMAKAYTANGGVGAGAVPWADIIQTIVSLFGGCMRPAAVRRWAKNHPDAAKAMIEEKLKGSFTSKEDRAAAAQAGYEVLLSMSDDELKKLMRG